MTETVSAYRNITYRLLSGSRGKAKKLAGLAGACRFVWNVMLVRQANWQNVAGESPVV